LILASHVGRVAIPAMKTLLIQSFEEGADVYVLTGRPSDSDWYDSTARQLAREGILPFVQNPERRLHTPGGKQTTLSKVHALYVISQYYQDIWMNDDDWPTIEFGAGVLPNVVFRYIYHGFPNYYPSNRDLKANPNITVLDLTRMR
jgi:hypothetical protein